MVWEKNNLSQWFKFFLVGIIETAKNWNSTIWQYSSITKTIQSSTQKLRSRAVSAKKVIDYLYNRPMLNAEEVSEIAEISMSSAYKLIADLEKFDILKEVTGSQRGRVYVFYQ